MTTRPAFALSFDPRALSDLLEAPSGIRDLALEQLHDVVTAERFGEHLTGDLEGYRKLVVDARRQWRAIYSLRSAPPTSPYRDEVYVLAVRPRTRNDVYDTVGRRLGMTRRPLSARTHAARARSPQLAPRNQIPKPAPPKAPRSPISPRSR